MLPIRRPKLRSPKPRSPKPCPLAATLMACALAAGPALAQTPPAPGPAPASDPAPVPTPAPAPAPALAPAAGAVESAPLDSLDFFSAAGRRTGLPGDLWKGASADLARSVIAGLGQRPPEPGFGQLAQQLLATGARGPDGAHDDADLAGERVLALIRLGDFEGARGVLARTPGVAAHARLSQAAATLALWSGDLARACAVGDALSDGRDGGFWLRLRALCLAGAGKTSEAQLALELAAAAPARDPTVGALVAAAVSGAKPPPASADSALAYGASRALKLDLAGVVAAAPRPGLRALASDESLPAELRRRAALRLIQSGADAAEVIRPVLLLPVPAAAAPAPEPPAPRKGRRAVHPRPAPVAAPSDAEQAAELARLYAAARTATDPAERTRALIALLRPAQGPAFRALSGLAAPELALVAPDGLGPDDRQLLALAAATVDAASAQPLRESLKRDEPGGPSALNLAILDAVRALVAPQTPAGPVLDRLVELGGRTPGAESVRAQGAAMILFAVADPAAAPLSPLARQQLSGFEPGPARHAAAAMLADAAAARGAAGETALLALAATLGTTVAPTLDGQTLSPAERALVLAPLTRAGLGADARSVALDGLLRLAGR